MLYFISLKFNSKQKKLKPKDATFLTTDTSKFLAC